METFHPTLIVICVLWCAKVLFGSYQKPSIDLASCLHETAVINIHNTTSGGLAYIRTDSYYQVTETVDGSMVLECLFTDCNIKWDEKFFIVVQRRVFLQSSDDVINWFVCNTDFGSIFGLSIGLSPMIDENATSFVARPDGAEITFVSSSGSDVIPTGSIVKLGTQINMIISIIGENQDTFDIFPRTCWTSSIQLVTDKCATEPEIFGDFTRMGTGVVANTFSMFRPTTYSGGPYQLIFTCILEVCMYNCEKPVCGDNQTSSNVTRRRRQTDVEDQQPPSMTLGAMLRAVAEGEEVESDVIAPSSLEVCLALETLIVILALWTLITVTIVAITTYSTVRYHNYNKVITDINSTKKASEGTSAVVNHKALSENAYANQIPSVNTPTTKQVKLVNVLKETKRAGDVPPTGDVVTLSNRTTYNTQLCTNTHALYPEFPKTNAVRRKSIEMRDIVKN